MADGRRRDDDESYWRRLAEVYEVDRVRGGRPEGRTLFRWQAAGDRFEAVEAPHGFAQDAADREARAEVLAELASSGRTGAADVRQAVEAYRAG